MTFKNISIVHASYLSNEKKHLIGRLAIKNREIFFEYSSDFLQTKIELPPFKLPLKR